MKNSLAILTTVLKLFNLQHYELEVLEIGDPDDGLC